MTTRVLVTGGTGFVGSHTVAALRGIGHDVVLLARTPAKVGPALAPFGCAVDVVEGDMTDPESVALAMQGCDAVVHTAGEIGVGGGTGPAGSANLDGVRTVVGGAVEAGVESIVYTSTITAYLPTGEAVLTPDSPLASPLSTYGASKLEAEMLVREWQDDGAPITSFTIGGVYGPVSPHLEGSFAALLGALGGFMFVPPGGLGVVDVRDIAAMLARAAELPGTPRRLMAGGRHVTWEQWTALLEAASGVPIGRQEMSADDMVSLGRTFDEQRSAGGPPGPLSEEAAVIMSAGVPTHDTATHEALGIHWRPTEETFADAVAWLRSEGHLDHPEPAGEC